MSVLIDYISNINFFSIKLIYPLTQLSENLRLEMLKKLVILALVPEDQSRVLIDFGSLSGDGSA